MGTTESMSQLSAEDLQELLKLMKGSDSVELKLTVPDADHRSAVAALGLDPLDAQIRQVFFFDTPDLVLNRAGVVARARRVQGKGGRLGREAAAGRSGRAPGDAHRPAWASRSTRCPAATSARPRSRGDRHQRRGSKRTRGKRATRKLFTK